MAGTKKKEDRGTVFVTRNWADGFTSPRDGWAIPRKLKADAELPGGVHVTIDIEVGDGQARARRVCVETDNPRGVGWSALAKAPIRDIVGTAVLETLMKTAPGDEGTVQLLPPGRSDATAVREVVQAAVGYSPKTEDFKTEVASL